MWVFGYGSLMWRPAFPFAERLPARITGWKRRFWQGSVDHRGVPGAPGRVVTLLPASDEIVVGVAFRVAPDDVPAVLETLDIREVGGYDRFDAPTELADGRAVTSLVYVATETNRNFLGDAPIGEIAATIRSAHGPSGPNLEYLLELAGALDEMGVRDGHVEELVAAIAEL